MKGSCLCKGIQYEVKKLSTPIMQCSCSTCRKAHGAAFNTAAGVLPEDFQWTQGESLLSEFESSPGKRRQFCSVCGSQLLSTKEGAPFHILRVATLDEDPGSKPAMRIWKSHEVSWLDYQSEIPEYAEWHPSK